MSITSKSLIHISYISVFESMLILPSTCTFGVHNSSTFSFSSNPYRAYAINLQANRFPAPITKYQNQLNYTPSWRIFRVVCIYRTDFTSSNLWSYIFFSALSKANWTWSDCSHVSLDTIPYTKLFVDRDWVGKRCQMKSLLMVQGCVIMILWNLTVYILRFTHREEYCN